MFNYELFICIDCILCNAFNVRYMNVHCTIYHHDVLYSLLYFISAPIWYTAYV